MVKNSAYIAIIVEESIPESNLKKVTNILSEFVYEAYSETFENSETDMLWEDLYRTTIAFGPLIMNVEILIESTLLHILFYDLKSSDQTNYDLKDYVKAILSRFIFLPIRNIKANHMTNEVKLLSNNYTILALPNFAYKILIIAMKQELLRTNSNKRYSLYWHLLAGLKYSEIELYFCVTKEDLRYLITLLRDIATKEKSFSEVFSDAGTTLGAFLQTLD